MNVTIADYPPADLKYELSLTGTLAEATITIISVILLVFLIAQNLQGRSDWEVVYINSVSVAFYGGNLAGFNFHIFRLGSGEFLQLGTYLYWVLSCPVILLQYSHVLSQFGPEQDHGSTNKFIVLDVLMVMMGVLTAVSTDDTLRWTFFVISMAFGAVLFVNIIRLCKRRLAYYPPTTHAWLRAYMALFLASWCLYPFVFLLGPATKSSVLSIDASVTLNAFLDIFAKAGFSLMTWYIRWIILEPIVQAENRTTAKYNPFVSLSLSFNASQANNSKQFDLGKLELAGACGCHFHGISICSNVYSVLVIVEAHYAYQRLLMLLLDHENISIQLSHDLNGALKILQRNPSLRPDAIMVDLTYCWQDPEELDQFRKIVGADPYNIPVLGYTFDEIYDENKFNSFASRYCNGIIRHAHDHRHILRIVEHHRKNAAVKVNMKSQVLMLGKCFYERIHLFA